MGRSGAELAAAPIRAMSKATGLVADHWVILCLAFALLAMGYLIVQIVWETRAIREMDRLYQQAMRAESTGTQPRED